MWTIRLLKKANEEGVDASVISERYIKEAQTDMEGLNVKEATTIEGHRRNRRHDRYDSDTDR